MTSKLSEPLAFPLTYESPEIKEAGRIEDVFLGCGPILTSDPIDAITSVPRSNMACCW